MDKPFLPELPMVPQDATDTSSGKFRDYEDLTKRWLNAAYEEARGDVLLSEDIKNQTKYIDYMFGKQWPSSRPTYRAAPVDNRVWRLMWELVALLTDIRPIAQIKGGADEYKDAADICTRAMRSWWTSSDSDMKLAFGILYSILCTGYLKQQWTPELKQGMGDFELVPYGPLECLPLKPKFDLQSAQGVIQDSAKELAWIKERFPLRGSMVQADPNLSRYSIGPKSPSHIPQETFEILSPQMQRIVAGSPQYYQTAFPMARYREFWMKDWSRNTSNAIVTVGDPKHNWSYKVKPGEKLYPRGRLYVMGGNVLLYDGPNPYWHGMHPYADIRLNAVPWQWLGISELRPLIPLQDIINTTLAGIIDAVRKAVNPILYAPRNAVSDAVLNAIDFSMPGAKLMYNSNAAQKPDFAPTPQLPTFLMQLVELAAREMDQSSGIAAVDQAVRKNQVPSGDTLEQIRETKQTPIRLKGRNIEACLRSLGTMFISNMFQFYGMRRRLFMFGEAGLTNADFDWDPATIIPSGKDPMEFSRNFSFIVEAGSLLNVNRVERAITMQRLRQTGDIDRRTLLTNLALGIDIDKTEENLKTEALQKAGLLGQQQLILAASQAAAQAGNPQLAAFLQKLISPTSTPITVTDEARQLPAI
jgi:hypothetical protein